MLTFCTTDKTAGAATALSPCQRRKMRQSHSEGETTVIIVSDTERNRQIAARFNLEDVTDEMG